jgi:SAM-dependent methyltransferase
VAEQTNPYGIGSTAVIADRDFGPIADSLRRNVIEYYRNLGDELGDGPGPTTLETNSGYAERRARLLLEMLTSQVGLESIEGLRLLDLGCGFGALSAYFAAQGAQVTGIDANENRLTVGSAVAAEFGLPVEFHPARMQALGLPDGSFDLAVQNNSLCYIVPRDERRAALSEAMRVLRPGGSVIVRNPNRWTPIDQFSGIPLIQLMPPPQAARLAEALGRPRSLVRLTSPFEAAREMRAAGFVHIRQPGSRDSGWRSWLKSVAPYQHFVAQRPD